jgi:glycine C-acetyltransferase
MPVTLERRKCSRMPLVGLEISSRNTGALIGKSKDISPNGMFIETKNPLKPFTKVLIEFKLPGEIMPIKPYSEVKWNKKGLPSETTPLGMGVQFVNIYESDKIRLARYSKSLNSESSPKQETINSDDLTLIDFLKVSGDDLFMKTKPLWEYVEDIKQKGFYTYRRPLLSACRNRVAIFDELTGKEREMIMMGSNNYLGLTAHPRVMKAAEEAVEKYGVGAASAPLLAGTFDLHRKLETRLAKLKGFEDAMIFPTGYSTSIGCISALVRERDLAVVDRLAHASLIDGCILSSGKFKTFQHSDMKNLKEVLEKSKGNFDGKLIVVEGVYSMDGDIAPLPEIVDIARENKARVMLDDAHATGVIGEKGKGTLSHFKMEGKIDIVMGTFSKSFGQLGGFAASSKEVINYLRYFARPYFFSASLSPVIVASVLAAIDVIENQTELHQNLWKNIRYFKENLQHLGFNIGNSESAIIPIIIGDELLLRKMSKRIHEEGLFINPIPYPAVPRNQTRFRITVMATHTKEDLDAALEVLEKVGREFSILKRGFSIFSRKAA